jgi:hypothetical protein
LRQEYNPDDVKTAPLIGVDKANQEFRYGPEIARIPLPHRRQLPFPVLPEIGQRLTGLSAA